MKKLKLTLLACITSFGFLSLNSCSEDSLIKNQDDKENYVGTYQQRESANPLEYVGIEHNKFMEKFVYHLELSIEDNLWDGVEFLSEQFKVKYAAIMNKSFHSYYPKTTSTEELQVSLYEELYLHESFDGDSINELDLAESILDSKATLKDKKYTIALLKDVYKAIDDSKSDEEAYKRLEEVVEKHERIILLEDWKDNENNALGALAIAKYSTKFWKDYYVTKPTSSNTISRKKPKRSSIVVGADVAGYVIGGVTGGLAGSTLGPAGTVGGFLGGKVAGAMGYSSFAVGALEIYDMWSDYFSN